MIGMTRTMLPGFPRRPSSVAIGGPPKMFRSRPQMWPCSPSTISVENRPGTTSRGRKTGEVLSCRGYQIGSSAPSGCSLNAGVNRRGSARAGRSFERALHVVGGVEAQRLGVDGLGVGVPAGGAQAGVKVGDALAELRRHDLLDGRARALGKDARHH